MFIADQTIGDFPGWAFQPWARLAYFQGEL